jgi:hypothetical protein
MQGPKPECRRPCESVKSSSLNSHSIPATPSGHFFIHQSIHLTHPPNTHNEPISHPPLPLPRLTTDPPRTLRSPTTTHLGRALSPLAQTPKQHNRTSKQHPNPPPQHRKQQQQWHTRAPTPNRSRLDRLDTSEKRQRSHRRAQSPTALLRHDLHVQEVPRALVASHHQTSIPLWNRAGELSWVQGQTSNCGSHEGVS